MHQRENARRSRVSGREYDAFAGLQYSRARFYDPKLGRFISEDPIGFGGGDVNLYGYVGNNPVGYRDPLGLWPTGNDIADWLDSNVYYARDFYKGSSQNWYYNATLNTDATLISGVYDPLRVGSGIGYALYDGEATGGQRALAVGQDILRATVIYSVAGGVASRAMTAATRASAPAQTIKSCPLPYSKGRPPYGRGQVDEVWDAAKDVNGRVFDPYTGEELFWNKSTPRKGQWDMGHKDMPYRTYHRQYMNGEITLDQFKRIHRDSTNYRPESVRSNRSRNGRN